MKTNFKFPKQIFLASILFSGLFCFNACQKDIGPIVIPQNTQVNFETQIQPILNDNCVSCHDDNILAGGLDLRSGFAKANLVNIISLTYSPDTLVLPYNANNSVLVKKIIGDPSYGGIMPPISYPALQGYQIDMIKAWVNQGAQ